MTVAIAPVMVKPLPTVHTVGTTLGHPVILMTLEATYTVTPDTAAVHPPGTEVDSIPALVLALLLQLHVMRSETGAGTLVGLSETPHELLTPDQGTG